MLHNRALNVADRAQIVVLQHSPSILQESERGCKVFDLGAGERFGERVRNHVFGRAINEFELLVLHDPADEMKANVDVFDMCMVLVVLCE